MPIIKYPVGRGAYNHRDDVITIQIALSKAKAPNYKTFWPGKIDGRASPEFVDAITIFQHSQRVVANGRIGKNCPTNVRLEKILPKDAKNLAATIGGSKLQTFQSLREEYRDREVFVSGAAIENAPERFRLSGDEARDLLMPEDHWHFSVPLMKLSVLRLHFADGKLTKIIRVWAPTNLP